MGIIVLTWLSRFGHPCVILLGGATGVVGDPSGKDVERPLMSTDVLSSNLEAIKGQVVGLLKKNAGDGAPDPLVVNNMDWTGGLGLLDFLRSVGRFARVRCWGWDGGAAGVPLAVREAVR